MRWVTSQRINRGVFFFFHEAGERTNQTPARVGAKALTALTNWHRSEFSSSGCSFGSSAAAKNWQRWRDKYWRGLLRATSLIKHSQMWLFFFFLIYFFCLLGRFNLLIFHPSAFHPVLKTQQWPVIYRRASGSFLLHFCCPHVCQEERRRQIFSA